MLTNTTLCGSIKLTKEKESFAMYSVVKITEDKIYMLSDDGKMYKTDIANAKWNVQVGDIIAIHNIENEVILTKINKEPEVKKKPKNHAGFVKVCQKFLLPIFSVLFAISLIGFFVIALLPHGKTYKYNVDKENGDFVKVEIVFGKNDIDVTLDYLETIDFFDINSELNLEPQIIRENNTTKCKYKIEKKELYALDDTTGVYVKIGKISSTKIIFESLYEDESTGLTATIFLEEHTMQTLKTLSLVLFIVFAVLDLACVVVVILNKKGIIKTANESVSQFESNSVVASENTKNEVVNASNNTSEEEPKTQTEE